jgi:hypothetical protein
MIKIRYKLNERVEKALAALGNLETGWDLYSAEIIKPSNIELARDICGYFPENNQPYLTSEGNGTIGLHLCNNLLNFYLRVDDTAEYPEFLVTRQDGEIILHEEARRYSLQELIAYFVHQSQITLCS